MKILPVIKWESGVLVDDSPLWSLEWIRGANKGLSSMSLSELGLCDYENNPIILVIGDIAYHTKIPEDVKSEILKYQNFNYILCFVDDYDAIKYKLDKSAGNLCVSLFN